MKISVDEVIDKCVKLRFENRNCYAINHCAKSICRHKSFALFKNI